MIALSLAAARRVLGAATAKCAELRLKPMAVAILDARGCLKAFAAQDGTSLLRAEVAHGKAYGAQAFQANRRVKITGIANAMMARSAAVTPHALVLRIARFLLTAA